MNEDVLKNLQSEFKLWGVKPEVNYLNSGHIELVWNATPDKPQRRYIIPKTGSDWRGWLNARSKIRQLFKADGLSVKEQCAKAKAKPVLHTALAVPEPVERDADQIKLLRGEVADLSELVLNMMTMIKELIAVTPPVEVPQFLAAPAALPPEKPRKTNTKSIKTEEYISDQWSSTDAIARDMGLAPLFALRKLNYLLKTGKAELSFGRWRRKQPEEKQIGAVIAAKQRKLVNGNGRGKHHG